MRQRGPCVCVWGLLVGCMETEMKEEERYNAAEGNRRAEKGRERTEECVLCSVGRGF